MAKNPPIYPIAATMVANLVRLAKAYGQAADLRITTVGNNSTGTSSFFVDLESGKTSCTLRKYDLLTDWFVTKWPEGIPMPTLDDTNHYQPKGIINYDEAKVRVSGKSKERKKVGAKKAVSKSQGVRTKARRRA